MLVAVAVCAAAILTILTGAAMGLLSGSRPDDLGVANGRFAPCKRTPNCVSSQADAARDPGHYVAPLQFKGAGRQAWVALRSVVRGMERVNVVADRPDYLYAEFRSKAMGFVDDTEFLLEEKSGVIQVRSAARLGVRDFGVNRERIETVRARLAEALAQATGKGG